MTPFLLRVQARTLLLEQVRDHVADLGIAVVYRWSPAVAERLVIAGGDVEGEVAVRGMKAGRKPRTDSFDVQVFCFAGPGSVEADRTDFDPTGFASYDEQVAALIQHVDDVVADSPRLGGALGDIRATVDAVEGPNADTTTDGPASSALVTVHFEVHHS